MIFELSKENIELAKEEVLSLAGNKDHFLVENFLVCEANFDFNRLSFTRNIYKFIFYSNEIPELDWQKYYSDNFCVRSNVASKEKVLAKLIWDSVDNPVVKLCNSSSEFNFFFINEMILCGKLLWTRKERFHLRRPDLRPGFFPVSLKPKLARAMVNLSGVNYGLIFDPFCGTGGILLEASLVGLDVSGSDIDSNMLRAAKKNFDKYKVSGDFCVGDARKRIVKAQAIVTDPPYGRRASLKKVDIEKLYEEFLNHVYSFIDTVVLMHPKGMTLKSPYKVSFQTEEYIHKSLTRVIVVLKKV